MTLCAVCILYRFSQTGRSSYPYRPKWKKSGWSASPISLLNNFASRQTWLFQALITRATNSLTIADVPLNNKTRRPFTHCSACHRLKYNGANTWDIKMLSLALYYTHYMSLVCSCCRHIRLLNLTASTTGSLNSFESQLQTHTDRSPLIDHGLCGVSVHLDFSHYPPRLGSCASLLCIHRLTSSSP